MKSVETNLGLTQQTLVAMALLLGCDYLPGGVHGVGVERAVKLMSSLSQLDVLKRYWKLIHHLNGIVFILEVFPYVISL